MSQPEPNWQPISQIPLLTEMVDGILENSQEQHTLFLQAKKKPHVLDDATVQRAIRLYRAQLDDLWFYEEQFKRWQQEKLTEKQSQEITRLMGQLAQIRAVSEDILALLDKIKDRTIEQILKKSDLELGLEFFLKSWADDEE